MYFGNVYNQYIYNHKLNLTKISNVIATENELIVVLTHPVYFIFILAKTQPVALHFIEQHHIHIYYYSLGDLVSGWGSDIMLSTHGGGGGGIYGAAVDDAA